MAESKNNKLKRLRYGITLAALALAVAHIAFPKFELDVTTLILFSIGLLPWLAPLFKSVELPGGLKVEFQELQEVTDRAKEAGLLGPETKAPVEQSFQAIAAADPNLALAGVRIELEKRLRQLAAAGGYKQEAEGARNVRGLMLLLSTKDLIQ